MKLRDYIAQLEGLGCEHGFDLEVEAILNTKYGQRIAGPITPRLGYALLTPSCDREYAFRRLWSVEHGPERRGRPCIVIN